MGNLVRVGLRVRAPQDSEVLIKWTDTQFIGNQAEGGDREGITGIPDADGFAPILRKNPADQNDLLRVWAPDAGDPVPRECVVIIHPKVEQNSTFATQPWSQRGHPRDTSGDGSLLWDGSSLTMNSGVFDPSDQLRGTIGQLIIDTTAAKDAANQAAQDVATNTAAAITNLTTQVNTELAAVAPAIQDANQAAQDARDSADTKTYATDAEREAESPVNGQWARTLRSTNDGWNFHRREGGVWVLKYEQDYSAASSAPLNMGGVIIPFYHYLADVFTDVEFAKLIAAMREYRRTQFLVVHNPASGPGTTADANIQVSINLIDGVNGNSLGYVDTSYGARSAADVKADYTQWNALYSSVDGVFLDQVGYATTDTTQPLKDAKRAYYKQLISDLYEAGAGYVVANAGSPLLAEWYGDGVFGNAIVIISEGAALPTVTNMKGFGSTHLYWPRNQRSILLNNQQSKPDLSDALDYYGWLGVSDSVNYDTLPSWFSDFCADVEGRSSGAIAPSDNYVRPDSTEASYLQVFGAGGRVKTIEESIQTNSVLPVVAGQILRSDNTTIEPQGPVREAILVNQSNILHNKLIFDGTNQTGISTPWAGETDSSGAPPNGSGARVVGDSYARLSNIDISAKAMNLKGSALFALYCDDIYLNLDADGTGADFANDAPAAIYAAFSTNVMAKVHGQNISASGIDFVSVQDGEQIAEFVKNSSSTKPILHVINSTGINSRDSYISGSFGYKSEKNMDCKLSDSIIRDAPDRAVEIDGGKRQQINNITVIDATNEAFHITGHQGDSEALEDCLISGAIAYDSGGVSLGTSKTAFLLEGGADYPIRGLTIKDSSIDGGHYGLNTPSITGGIVDNVRISGLTISNVVVNNLNIINGVFENIKLRNCVRGFLLSTNSGLTDFGLIRFSNIDAALTGAATSDYAFNINSGMEADHIIIDGLKLSSGYGFALFNIGHGGAGFSKVRKITLKNITTSGTSGTYFLNITVNGSITEKVEVWLENISSNRKIYLSGPMNVKYANVDVAEILGMPSDAIELYSGGSGGGNTLSFATATFSRPLVDNSSNGNQRVVQNITCAGILATDTIIGTVERGNDNYFMAINAFCTTDGQVDVSYFMDDTSISSAAPNAAAIVDVIVLR